MSERRNFLSAASMISLGLVAAAARASGADQGGQAATTTSTGAGNVQPDAPALPIPPVSKVEEQTFRDYHLLGKPDQAANLLGTIRPHDWRSTKADLQRTLKTVAQAKDPIHNWLQTFSTSFDERASGIVTAAKTRLFTDVAGKVPRYEPQLYEPLLRGAAALLDRCLRYRNEMGEFEISGVNAGIGYLTFLKLRPLQRNFLIESNTADLSEIERSTDADAAQQYGNVGGLDRLFEKYQLLAKQIELAGSAAGAGAAEAKAKFLTHLLEQQFNIQVDAQLAQFTRLITSGSSSNFAERYLRLLSLLTEDLADAYCKLFSAARGVQQSLNLTSVTVGLNSPITVAMPVFTNAAAVKTWVDKVVPRQSPPQRQPDVVDACVLWCRAVMRTLDTVAQYESEFTVSIPLNQPWGSKGNVLVPPASIAAAFSGSSPTGAVTFTLAPTNLPAALSLANARVVGIGLSVEHSQDDQIPVQYSATFPHTPSNPNVAVGQTPADSQEPTIPQNAAARTFVLPKIARLNVIVTTPSQQMVGGEPYSRPKIFLPNVRLQGGGGGDFEPLLSYDPGCRGLNPFGGWKIVVDANALAYYQSAIAITDSWISGLILHLRLRGTLS